MSFGHRQPPQNLGSQAIEFQSELINDSFEIPQHPFSTMAAQAIQTPTDQANPLPIQQQKQILKPVSTLFTRKSKSHIETILGQSPISAFQREGHEMVMNQSNYNDGNNSTFMNGFGVEMTQFGEETPLSQKRGNQSQQQQQKQNENTKKQGKNKSTIQKQVTPATSANSGQDNSQKTGKSTKGAANPNSKVPPKQTKPVRKNSVLINGHAGGFAALNSGATPVVLSGVREKAHNTVYRAADKLLKLSQARRYNNLSEEGFRLINDQSHFTKLQLAQHNSAFTRSIISCCYSIKQCFRSAGSLFWRCWSAIPLFDPNTTVLMYWDVLHILCIILNLFYLMIEYVLSMSFIEQYGSIWLAVIIPSFAIFLIDIFLNFHTAIYEKGVVIDKKSTIAGRYVSSSFVVDILAFLPLYLSVTEATGMIRILTILILFKISRANNILAKYKDIFSSRVETKSLGYTITVMKLGMTILFAAHIFATFFLGLAYLIFDTDSSYNTWLIKNTLTEESWQVKYVYALYWAVCTMTTVGYGDITPQNPFEVGFVICTMFIACGFFAYTFNSIGSMVQEMAQASREFDDKMKLVNLYLESNNLTANLKTRVRKFFEYERDRMKTVSKKDEDDILSSIDKDLRDELQHEIGIDKYNKLKELTELFEGFSQGVQKQIFDISEEFTIRSEDSHHFLIDASEQTENYDFFIIIKGKAHIYMRGASEKVFFDDSHDSRTQKLNTSLQRQNVERPLVTLDKNAIFGQISFFTSEKRQFSVRCEKGTMLLRFSQKQFMEILKKNPNDFQTFCEMKDKMKVERDFTQANLKCYVCKEIGHDISRCNCLHFDADQDRVIRKMQDKDMKLEKIYTRPNFSALSRHYQRRRFKRLSWPSMKFNHALMVATAPYIAAQQAADQDQGNPGGEPADAATILAATPGVTPANGGAAATASAPGATPNGGSSPRPSVSKKVETPRSEIAPVQKLDPVAAAKALALAKNTDEIDQTSLDFLRSLAIQLAAGCTSVQDIIKLIPDVKKDLRETLTYDDTDCLTNYSHYFAGSNFSNQLWKMLMAKIRQYRKLGIPFNKHMMTQNSTMRYIKNGKSEGYDNGNGEKSPLRQKEAQSGSLFGKFMNIMGNK